MWVIVFKNLLTASESIIYLTLELGDLRKYKSPLWDILNTPEKIIYTMYLFSIKKSGSNANIW